MHIYFSAMQQAQERLEFDSFLIEIKNKILNGDIDIDNLDEKTSDIVNRYLDIVRSEDGIKINFKDLDTNEEYKYHGFFALISNKEKSASTCLIKYRKRNLIEQFFRAEKNSVDGKKPRVWDSFSLRGRLFIQFVALCYYEYIRHKINQIKESLGIKNGDKKHDTKLNLSKEIKLKTWLDNTPIYLILQWFDVIENVDVSTEIKQRRWNSAVLERDRLFLEKFGIEI